MSDTEYRDIRSDRWREVFERALPYREYLAQSPEEHRRRWLAMEERVRLDPADRARIESFTRTLHVLCHSGVWCGDCVRQGPMLYRIAEASPRIHLRFAERRNDSWLTDELRIDGAKKVPVAVFLSEEFFELGRFGDRTLTAYRRKAERELGPACETGIVPPSAEELAQELREWVDTFERMHWIVRLSPRLRRRYGD